MKTAAPNVDQMEENEKEYNLERLSAFLKRLIGFLRKRPASKQELDDLIADLNVVFHLIYMYKLILGCAATIQRI